MHKQLIKILVLCICAVISHTAQAASYSSVEKKKLRKILKDSGVSSLQEGLLIRRMEVRNIPVAIATEWVNEIHERHKQELPVEVVIDRLQQGLIKNIKPAYITQSIESLQGEMQWGSSLLTQEVIGGVDKKADLDSDEKLSIQTTVSNLEIASRQGHSHSEIQKMMSGRSVDIEMAEKISQLTTVWTSYGVSPKDVTKGLNRAIRVGLTVDDIEDIGEKLDSAVAVKQIVRPYDIIKFIWSEIRDEIQLKDAEYSYRTGMRENPNNPSAYGGGTDSGTLGISTSGTTGSSVGVTGGGDLGGSDAGGVGDVGGATDAGAGSGGDSGDSHDGGDSHDSGDSHEGGESGEEGGHD